ncbi:MAG: hypothetical protein KJ063_17765 [Anaerolineae bacterium]|nr:hypothetical protein [Anaerolineae bacterium]
MANHGHGQIEALRQLTAPARNNYFYGKLLDVMHFQMEQAYFNRKRWLLNRLGLGSGVLCGLELVVADNGQSVWLRPGVAIDPLGREIIVPAPYCLETPRQPTDEQGRPSGDPIPGEGVVTLCLGYHECATEPVPVLVGDCDTRQECAPSTIRERYRLLVRAGVPEELPGQITDEQCAAIFPTGELPDEFDHRAAACQNLSGPCLEPDTACVILGTITLPAVIADPLIVDSCTYRTTVYSNSLLWELMVCLADRVDQCCRTLLLRYVSGDAQQATPGTELPEPLVVEVVDGNGQLVINEVVTFRMRGGGGTIVPDTTPTDANGRAETRWTLGAAAGLNTMEATIASGSTVTFLALAVAGELPPLTCVDFEDLPEGETIQVGNSFVTSGVTITGRPFIFSDGTPTSNGFARIESGGQAGGTGQDVQVNNVNLAFAFPSTWPRLSMHFGEFGGNLNIEINGDFRNIANFADINGLQVGGVNVSVIRGTNNQGTLNLDGLVTAFTIGGQELWIDDVCPEIGETATPPVVIGIWPPNANNIFSNPEWLAAWREQPRVAIAFDREMREEQLGEPELLNEWLRLWQVLDQGEIIVRRLRPEFVEITDNFMGLTGFVAVYAFNLEDLFEPARYIEQIRAQSGNITDTGTPPLTLDAEFRGSRLTVALLETIWKIEEQEIFRVRDIWDRLEDTGATLPKSGDGNEGGRFQGWFELMRDQG